MKSLIASCIILLSITISTALGTRYIDNAIKEITETIEKATDESYDFDAVYNIALRAEKSFTEHKKVLSTLLNDRDIDEVETILSDLKSAAESQSDIDITKAKNRLISKLEQMKRLSAFNLDSIF